MVELNIYSATVPQELLSKTISILKDLSVTGDPLRTRWVIQPGRLWERDLRRRLADSGIAACLTFGSLRLTLERAFRLAMPERKLQDENQLFWALLDLLLRNQASLAEIGLKDSTAPRLWLASNTHNPSLAYVQLARLLAGILDDHATYRPHEVLKWLSGQTPAPIGDEIWIAPLAVALWGEPNSPRPLALQLPEFVRKLKTSKIDAKGFPACILAVLTGAQPQAYLEALGALSLACPVQLLVLETCERGLSDQMTTWKEVRTRWKAAGRKDDLQTYVKQENWLVPGTLQAFWGASGIKLQQQLVELEESLGKLNISIREAPLATGAPSGSSSLAILQDDIRLTHVPRGPEERLGTMDSSLLLINATSPLREMEGARDGIRAALEKDHSLQPADILVVLSDTNRYAPLLPAVFGSGALHKAGNGPDGLPRIPWHLADRSLRTDSDTIAALQDIMASLGTRITLPVLAGLLVQPAIQARLGFSQSETVELVDYLTEAGFRWGLKQKDREREDQPGRDDGMWTLDFALRRLAAGFAHPDTVVDPVGGTGGVTPLPAFEGLSSAKLAVFITWAHDLEAARSEFDIAYPLGSESAESGTWLGWLSKWIPRLLDMGGEREGQSILISRVTHVIAEGGLLIDPRALFSAGAFLVLFTEAAGAFELSLPLGQGIGGMTVASPRMARALPAKMIVVVGLSDGAWPRQDLIRPRGLLKTPLPGDRLRRDDDRLTTLEWVLAAGQSLAWTWQGRQEQTGEEVPPSVVLGELRDVCRSTFQNPDQAVRVLPMHGFDPRLFSGADVFSFDKIAASAAARLQMARSKGFAMGEAHWDARPLPSDPWALTGVLAFALTGRPPATWTSEEWSQLSSRLVSFWKLPCCEFLRVIGVQADDEFEMLPDREALTLDSLSAWSLRDDLIRELAQSDAKGAERLKRRLFHAGKLPPGTAGDKAFEETVSVANLIIATAKEAAGGSGKIIPLKSMDWTAGPDLVRVSASSNKAGQLLSARIEQLVLSALTGKEINCSVIGRPKDNKARSADRKDLPLALPEVSLKQLQRLTALALLGTTFPLPFFPESGEKYADTLSLPDAAMFYRDGNLFSGSAPESGKPACRLAYRGIDDPLQLGWPEAPDPCDEWKELVTASVLSEDESSLFTGVTSLVFGFWQDMKMEKVLLKEKIKLEKAPVKKKAKS